MRRLCLQRAFHCLVADGHRDNRCRRLPQERSVVAGRSRKSGRYLFAGRHLRALRLRPGSFDTGPFDEPPLARGAVENGDGILPRSLLLSQSVAGKAEVCCQAANPERLSKAFHSMAMMRAGPPVPPRCFGAPIKIVAPAAGSWSRLASPSIPNRPEGSQE